MPEPKAQLVDPQGPIDVPGINATGIITATGGFVGAVQGAATGLANTTTNLTVGVVTSTGFVGDVTGTASSVTKGANLSLGIVTATSFAGDVFGNAAGLSTTTAGLKLGIVSATSFAGNFTGIGSGITGTPHIQAGIMTATSFAGNFTGLASGITGTPNLMVGILTGTSYSGDGSNLTGIAATNWIANNVTANSSTTTVDLSDGNVVNFAQSSYTTVSFANTGTSNIVSFIRTQTESFSSGGVNFDGTGDYLSLSPSSDLAFGTGDYTVECWIKPTVLPTAGYLHIIFNTGGNDNNTFFFHISVNQISVGNQSAYISNQLVSPSFQSGKWYHIAACRSGTTLKLFVNGTQAGSDATDNIEWLSEGTDIKIGTNDAGNQVFNGVISNFRVLKGTALYTSDFEVPIYELTNITNTKLLCCQDTSSTTVGAVKPGTITANGDPVAGSHTIDGGSAERTITWPSSIKWDSGTAPTLNTTATTNDANVITLLTRDEGVTWYGWETISSSGGYYMFMWGDNEQGRYGNNAVGPTQKSSPTQMNGGAEWNKLYGSVASQSMVAPGSAMAARQLGTLWMWGDNQHGMLGQNNTTQYSSPVQVPGTNWAQVASSGYSNNSAAAVKTDGTFWTWGNNGGGRLGQNQKAPQLTALSSPTQVGSGWRTTDYSMGCADLTTMAIKSDNTLWGWGAPYASGIDFPGGYRSSPVQIGSDTTWSKLSVGQGNSYLATKTDGTMWAWGYNLIGMLGLNSPGSPISPAQIPGTDWGRDVFMSYGGAAAVKTNGQLWVWGDNRYGNLGQNYINNPGGGTTFSSPIQIPGTTWSKVALYTYNSTAALKTDGTLWTWGRDSRGSLGLGQQGNDAMRSSPTQVPGTNWIDIATAYLGFTAFKSGL